MKLNYRNNKNAEAVAKYWGKSLDKSDWYKIQNKEEDTEILIYDVIGWPFIDADIFVRELAEIKSGNITLRINSPGGDVFDGFAIFNALQAHPSKVTAKIEGLAASIASVIPLAADDVQAYPNAMIMIHNSWALSAGNKDELRDIADVLEKIDSNIVDTYFNKSNMGRPALRKMMDKETWLTAKEAQDKGFIDKIIDGDAPKAGFDLSMFTHVPDGMSGEREEEQFTSREIERVLRDAGCPVNLAKKVAAGCSTKKENKLEENLRTLIERIK